MNKPRPVNLDLASLKFPPMAIASILHRVSGLILFILLPLILLFIRHSLTSEPAFQCASRMLSQYAFYKLVCWAFVSAWFYHLFAGTRHILMDMGCGETLCAGKLSAYVVIGLAVLTALGLGVYIWSM